MSELSSARKRLQRAKLGVDTCDKVLVIGNVSRWQSEGRPTTPPDGFLFTELGALTKSLLQEVCPDIVLSPLIGDDFDASDIAHCLHRFGYTGRYRAISDEVTDPKMIRDEIQSQAPGVDFNLLSVPARAANG